MQQNPAGGSQVAVESAAGALPGYELSVIIPSFNERDNVVPLVERLNIALEGIDAEILYVDDSTDDTPVVVAAVAEISPIPIRLLHREIPSGGLSGAVSDGIRYARGTYVVVMDGDLQHPAGLVPILLENAARGPMDVVVASRYIGEGDASGLSSSWRRSVSSISTLLARSCFPRRIGRVCTDSMTGFFCIRRDAVDLDRLRPRGFKILLEILGRHDLRVAEIPFVFGRREDGESKASWRNGIQFLYQMASLRLGRMSRFAAIGGVGTLLNLAMMWTLVHLLAVNYVVAAVAATEITILHNFLLQERFVFHDLKSGAHRWRSRIASTFAFNNLEAAIRIPILVMVVSTWHLYPVTAQAVTLALAFFARFFFASRVIYRQRVRNLWKSAETDKHDASHRPGTAVSGSGLSGAELATTATPQTRQATHERTAAKRRRIGMTIGKIGLVGREQARRPRRRGADVKRSRPRSETDLVGSQYAALTVVAVAVVLISISVFTIGLYATGLAVLTLMAVIFGVAAGVEASWRLYGRRDPEAIQEMGFPPLTARTGQDSFSIIVPAKDEVEVLHETLEALAQQTHQNVQIIATLIEGDDATIAEAEVARARYPDRIEILVKKYDQEMKPHQLNAALEICTGDYVGVIDAEDATATQLLRSVEAAFQTTDADVIQGPVQLMTLGSRIREWFMVHNVLEYLFWFSSRMMFQARHGFVPLGGNTVFIRRELLTRAGGWPISLTEDCALGVKLSTQFGAKVVALYDPALATREETPDNVHQLLHQRIRWDTGFGVELLQKKWRHLPSLERRLLAWYILATPFLQASTGLLLPVTLATAILVDAPVALVLLTFLPYIPILLSVVLQVVGLHEFGKMFEQKVRLRHYAFLVFGFFPYQLVLAWAALRAVLRIATGNMTWFKTAHSNKHRDVVVLPRRPIGEAA
jgi:dolichol-phosphate mannosyltransferase